MRLKINLATRRYVNTGALNAILGTLMVLAALFLLWQVKDIAYNQGELKRLKEASTGASTARGAQVSEPQYRSLMGKIRFANSALEHKALDWVTLLDRLEEVLPPGVALTQIQPNQADQVLKLTGVAKSFANIRAFMENLEQSRNFSEVYLLSQQETKVGLTQHGVGFTLSCKVPLKP